MFASLAALWLRRFEVWLFQQSLCELSDVSASLSSMITLWMIDACSIRYRFVLGFVLISGRRFAISAWPSRMFHRVDLSIAVMLLDLVLLGPFFDFFPFILCSGSLVEHHLFAHGIFVSHLKADRHSCWSLANQLLR